MVIGLQKDFDIINLQIQVTVSITPDVKIKGKVIIQERRVFLDRFPLRGSSEVNIEITLHIYKFAA